TLLEQCHRAVPSIHQEADRGEPGFPLGGGCMQNDRGIRGHARHSQRSDPLGREGRCRSTAPVHPLNLRHCWLEVSVVRPQRWFDGLLPPAYLQQNLVDDPVTLILDEDLKVGDVVVARAGCKALATISNAKKAGMMGKAG